MGYSNGKAVRRRSIQRNKKSDKHLKKQSIRISPKAL